MCDSVCCDSAAKNVRLIGVEYMVTKEIYETLDAEEQKLWHSHEVCLFHFRCRTSF